jgi:hypothetical protein
MRSRYGSNIAFVDLMMNAMLGVTALFIITFLLIRDDQEVSPLEEPPIEIMVTLTWPGEVDADVDLWVQFSPQESDVVGFRSPKNQGIYLDIDDLGRKGDIYKGKHKSETIEINQEIINFRRIPSDEIVVNAMHYFAKEADTPVDCTVQVIKLNPFSVIYEGTKTLYRRGEETTFVRFKINDEGEAYDLNYLPKTIVYAKSPYSSSNSWDTIDRNDPAIYNQGTTTPPFGGL